MADHTVETALKCLNSSTETSEAKRAAEAQLKAFSKSTDGTKWAVSVLPSAVDPQTIFYAADILTHVVTYKWQQLPHTQQLAIKQLLWDKVMSPPPHQPRFCTRKLASVLGTLICLQYLSPELWNAIQESLNDAQRIEFGLMLLEATMEQLQTLAQASQTGMKGNILAAKIPVMKERLSQIQPTALQLLFNAANRTDIPSLQTNLALRAYALDIFRKVLSDTPSLVISGIQLPELITSLSVLIRDSLAHPEASTVAVTAIGCLSDVLSKIRGTPALQQALAQVITGAEMITPWLVSPLADKAERLVKIAYIGLLVQYISVLLGCSALGDKVYACLLLILQTADAAIYKTSSPIEFLMLLELWHTLLEHMESLDEEEWLSCNENAVLSCLTPIPITKSLLSMLEESTLRVVNATFDSLFSQNAALACISLGRLRTEPGSGGEMEESLATLVSSPNDDAEYCTAADEDEGQETGGGTYSTEYSIADDSELAVYSRFTETFLARAVNTYSKEIAPLLIKQFRLQAHMLSVLHTAEAPSGDDGSGVVFCAVKLDLVLKLMGRCGLSLGSSLRESIQKYSVNAATGGNDSLTMSGQGILIREVLQSAVCWRDLLQRNIADIANTNNSSNNNQRWNVQCAMLAKLGCQVHKSLGSLAYSWIPHILLSSAGIMSDPQSQTTVSSLVIEELAAAAQTLEVLCTPPILDYLTTSTNNNSSSGMVGAIAVSAAQQVLGLTSIALSSGMKPPEAVLRSIILDTSISGGNGGRYTPGGGGFQSIHRAATHGISHPEVLPLKACQMLWTAVSDLTLRSWSNLLSATDVTLQEERSAAFKALVAPLLETFSTTPTHISAGPNSSGGGFTIDSMHIKRLKAAASAATSIIQSYAGSKKSIRVVVYSGLVAPLLNHMTTIFPMLIGCVRMGSSEDVAKAANGTVAAMLRMLSASLETLPTELPTGDLQTLFSAVFGAFLSGQNNTQNGVGVVMSASFEAEEQVAGLLVKLLSRGGGGGRHELLVNPAVRFCVDNWENIEGMGKNREHMHAKTQLLAAALSILRHHYAMFIPTTTSQQQNQQPVDLETLHKVLTYVCIDFFNGASFGAEVLLAADVRLILEELYDLHSITKLYSNPVFQPYKPVLMERLLLVMLGRLHMAVQTTVSDTLYLLAASNWSDFLLSFLPGFAEKHLQGLGPAAATSLVAGLGTEDFSASDWDEKLLCFLNDAWYYQQM